MMKPIYKSRKLWVSAITVASMVALQLTGKEHIAEMVTAIGMALVAGLGLEDLGKGREAVRNLSMRPPPPSNDVEVDLDV